MSEFTSVPSRNESKVGIQGRTDHYRGQVSSELQRRPVEGRIVSAVFAFAMRVEPPVDWDIVEDARHSFPDGTYAGTVTVLGEAHSTVTMAVVDPRAASTVAAITLAALNDAYDLRHGRDVA